MNKNNNNNTLHTKEQYKQCWYTKGLNALLSSRGYVQWVTKEPMNEDYDEGIAYFFDPTEKKFGKCAIISSSKFEEAKEITEYFRKIIIMI